MSGGNAPPDSAPRRGGARDGFVLVSVLAVLALLAGIVVAASLSARSAAGTARLSADLLIADALTDAGIALAGYQLYALGRAPAEIDGQQIRLEGGTVRLSATAESERIDLNGADARLLAGLWRAVGRDAMAPAAFASRVAEWRGDDGEPGADDVEAADDAAAGPASAADVGAFRHVGELGDVTGVGPADVAALAPFLTVYNPDGTVDPLLAAPTVLAALPGATENVVARILALRADPARGPPEARRTAIEQLLPEARGILATGPSRAHRVTVEVRAGGLAPVTTAVVLVRGANPGAVYHTLARARRYAR